MGSYRTKQIMVLWSFLVLLFFVSKAEGQNPISPPGIYIADPSAHVWKDGKLYVYDSLDESPTYYCSKTYHVLSTADMKNWTLTKNSFASAGTADAVSYSDDFLYAPDVQYANGKYYLYYCLANRKSTEGVAVSQSPIGPFGDAKIINTNKINEIDPCVFIDDDGQAYYIWGQFTAKMAKLKPNMVEIDSTTIRDNIVTEKEHRFHEGGYMVKRKGIYYFVYAGLSVKDMPTCISYATSKSPWGPFKYGGIIINNDGCDPGNWNNHGSLVEFKKQWYVFYHRATHNSNTMRKACVEKIYFNKDGSIPEVEMTTQGAGEPLLANTEIEAERACLLNGSVNIKLLSESNEGLTDIKSGDRIAYKYIDFGNGADSITVRVFPGRSAVKIRIMTDAPWSAKGYLGTIEIPADNNQKDFIEVKAPIKSTKGVHAVWLSFQSLNPDGFKVDWFVFK
ncbi:MAG: family 43 glycosylhydrolase [Paludibacter sp.]